MSPLPPTQEIQHPALDADTGALQRLLVRHRRALTVAVNLGVASAAYGLGVGLRFDFDLPPEFVALLPATLALVVLTKLPAFWAAGLFAGSWRHVSIRDVEDIVRGNLLGSSLFLCAMVFGVGLQHFPRSIFIIDLLLCTLLMAGLRVALRLVRERRTRAAVRRIDTLALIVGAGSAGIRLLEEIESRARLSTAIVGFVDDDPAKQGLRIAGTPVLGTLDELGALVRAHDVNEVLIAIPSAPGAVMRRIVRRCEEVRVRHRVLPSLGELVEGRVMFTQMREVKVDDLLAREPVRLDGSGTRALIEGRTVLVTGAAGSIGSELCRQAAAQGPARLVLVDRHENGMFHLEMELRARHPTLELVPVLGDIVLQDQIRGVFETYRPEIVFHAAAYKHVPLAERNALEAIRNNVLGTRNCAQAAVACGTRRFVLVSTDKAVRPTSVMGATKRVAERLVQEIPARRCRFLTVRFGNVLGSSGSVVPLFREQIARGGPVTVTDPRVTRYFMTIPEAAQLILQAAALGRGSEVFVLEMGEPVPIVDLARQMIRLSGFEPDEDISVVFTGLRPGEKLEEELVDEHEDVEATRNERIRVIRSPRTALPAGFAARLEACVRRADVAGALWCIREAVPGYRPSDLVTVPVEAPALPAPEVVVEPRAARSATTAA